MLYHCVRYWPNINKTLARRLVFAGCVTLDSDRFEPLIPRCGRAVGLCITVSQRILYEINIYSPNLPQSWTDVIKYPSIIYQIKVQNDLIVMDYTVLYSLNLI